MPDSVSWEILIKDAKVKFRSKKRNGLHKVEWFDRRRGQRGAQRHEVRQRQKAAPRSIERWIPAKRRKNAYPKWKTKTNTTTSHQSRNSPHYSYLSIHYSFGVILWQMNFNNWWHARLYCLNDETSHCFTCLSAKVNDISECRGCLTKKSPPFANSIKAFLEICVYLEEMLNKKSL